MAIAALAGAAAGLTPGCASTRGGSTAKEEPSVEVSLAKMSAPARATVEKITAGGKVEKISKEIERGQTVYDVEATVGGQHLEYVIAQADGTVLGTEVPIEFDALPRAVQAAAARHFDSLEGLQAMKGVEYGQTSYEIEGLRKGKSAEATFDETGKLVEEE